MIKEEIAQSVAENLFAEEPMNAFAVLDGASIPDLLANLYQLQPDFVCLYRGELEPDMASVAPYLIHVRPQTQFADWLIKQGWGEHWGIFALSESDLVTMRKHFRTFLTVYDTDGKPMLFRYYDPRVLRLYLPTCNAEELKTVFGPVVSYMLEDEDPNTLRRFQLVKETLKQENKSLLQKA